MRMKPVPFIISHQGKPLINGNHLSECIVHPDIVYGSIDMQSKRCVVLSYGDNADEPSVPVLFIAADENSLNLGDADGPTEIQFPTLAEFIIQMAEISRYTLRIVFTRE